MRRRYPEGGSPALKGRPDLLSALEDELSADYFKEGSIVYFAPT